MTLMSVLISLVLLLVHPATLAQISGPITESAGRYQSAEEKASLAYGRGLRAMEKARKQEAAGQADKALKSWQRAKEEFSRAAGLQFGYFDALLGLGQAHLALGDAASALNTCRHALALKPDHRDAKACVEQAAERAATSGESPKP